MLPLISEWSPFFSPPRFLCWILALAVVSYASMARHERESSLSPRECESGEMCVMGMGERVDEMG